MIKIRDLAVCSVSVLITLATVASMGGELRRAEAIKETSAPVIDYAEPVEADVVEADLVEGIIALPSQLFYSTGIPVSLWFLSRHKQQPGRVLFIDARNMGTMVTRAVRELMADDISKIAATFDSYRRGTLEDEAGYCAVRTLEDVKAQDFILTPGRYVGIAEQEDDGEPFDEKMKRLTSELSTLFNESHRLEDEIKKQLDSIGFGIE